MFEMGSKSAKITCISNASGSASLLEKYVFEPFWTLFRSQNSAFQNSLDICWGPKREDPTLSLFDCIVLAQQPSAWPPRWRLLGPRMPTRLADFLDRGTQQPLICRFLTLSPPCGKPPPPPPRDQFPYVHGVCTTCPSPLGACTPPGAMGGNWCCRR